MITAITMGSILSFSTLFSADFTVDKTQTNLGFKVRHLMISNTKGDFEDFNGTFSYDPKTRRLEALNGEVKVASVNTDEADRDADLRSGNFFDAAKYPTMTMKFVEQKGDKVTVALTIKDVTKNIVLEMADPSDIIKDPWGNRRVGFTLEGEINRKDFHLNYSKLMETGGLVVGDEVKLELEIEGIQNK